MCDCSKKEQQFLNDKQVQEGRIIIRDTLIAFTVGQRAEFERIFAEDNPRYPGPSVVQYGKIAYCAKPEDRENHTKRTRTSLGRYLGRQEGVKMGAHIENACNAAMAAIAHFYPVESQFEILRGEDLREAYKKNVGGGSCMSGSDEIRQRQLNFYAGNPDRVGLLVWGKKRARALIWTLPKGGYYIDRLYSGDGNAAQAYESWAKANNVLYSFEGDIAGTKPISANPVEFEMEYQGSEFPYFDTLDRIGGKVFSLGGRCRCDRCNEQCRQGGTHYIETTEETVCGSCFDEYYGSCARCDRNFLYEDGREISCGDTVCEGCAEHYTECEICCILYDETITTSDGMILCENCCDVEGYQLCSRCDSWKQEEFDTPEGRKAPVCQACCKELCAA